MSRTCARWVARYRWHACRFSSLVLAICSGEGGGLGCGGCCFFFAARRSRLRFKISSLFFTYHSCFRCFAKSGSLLGILNKTGSCLGSLSISIVLSANHSPRSRDGAGGNLVPVGVHPSSSSCSSNPSPDHHLSPFHQSPDDHLIRFHPFEIM